MKNGALTLALLVVTGSAAGIAFAGCSSDPPETVAPADTGPGTADTGTPDTKPPPDTNPPDTAVIRCDQPVGADYMCPPAPSKTGATVCNDVALTELLAACFGGSDAAKCTAWRAKYKDCDKCALGTWLYTTMDGRGFLDYPACMQKVDPAAGCGVAGECWNDCRETVCGECDDMERSACETRARRSTAAGTTPKGSCYENSYKKYNECTKDPKFENCVSPLEFLRGACRDNGNWTEAKIDKTPDSGVTDTGSADTGTAVSDAADGG